MSDQPPGSTLPATMDLREMLLDMLGRDVKVTSSAPWAPTPRDPGTVAVYIDDQTRLRALISCDLELSVVLGASIALIPLNTTTGCMKEGVLTEELEQNLNEVLNILAAVFNMPDRPHVKLDALHVPGGTPPIHLAAQLRAFGRREDLKIEVAGYGGGRLSVVLV